jgi:hypothetical protein
MGSAIGCRQTSDWQLCALRNHDTRPAACASDRDPASNRGASGNRAGCDDGGMSDHDAAPHGGGVHPRAAASTRRAGGFEVVILAESADHGSAIPARSPARTPGRTPAPARPHAPPRARTRPSDVRLHTPERTTRARSRETFTGTGTRGVTCTTTATVTCTGATSSPPRGRVALRLRTAHCLGGRSAVSAR